MHNQLLLMWVLIRVFFAANICAQKTHEVHPHCVYVSFRWSFSFFNMFILRTNSQNSKIYDSKKKLNVANVIDYMSWCAINIHTTTQWFSFRMIRRSMFWFATVRMRLIPSIFSVRVNSHRHLFRRSAHVHSDSDVSNEIHSESEFRITRSLLVAA